MIPKNRQAWGFVNQEQIQRHPRCLLAVSCFHPCPSESKENIPFLTIFYLPPKTGLYYWTREIANRSTTIAMKMYINSHSGTVSCIMMLEGYQKINIKIKSQANIKTWKTTNKAVGKLTEAIQISKCAYQSHNGERISR